MRRLLLFVPITAFVVVGIFALAALRTNDQSVQPSVLIDQPVPRVSLDPLPGHEGPFGHEDFEGQVSLVNVFGSWCAACRIEHPLLLEIGEGDEVALYGIDWADTPARGAQWLDRFGNPYDRVGNDEAGRAVIEYGVTGAPETFVVDAKGNIRYRHVGPITQDTWEKTLEPMIERLRAEASETS